MSDEAEVRWSNKAALNSQQQLIVVRGQEVFLRLLGRPGSYELMTATAGEDDNSYVACADQARLIQAALETAHSIQIEPLMDKDRHGRAYVKIYGVRFNDQSESAKSEACQALNDICNQFFAHYDEGATLNAGGGLHEIYRVLAVDDSGDAVYLSDGLWLGSDSSVTDLRR